MRKTLLVLFFCLMLIGFVSALDCQYTEVEEYEELGSYLFEKNGDYFGLNGTPRTLSDIGEDFNLTKERVRQIKEKALRKLRNESRVLLDYIE